MSLLTAHNLGQYFGGYTIFTGISADIPQGARIGLVGPNGVGKTTLLQILAGISEPASGRVTLARDVRIGYLRQEAVEAFAARDLSVYAEMLTVFAALQAQAAQLQALEARMAAGEDSADLLETYGAVQEGFTAAGGYDYESRIASVLTGLGFPPGTWETPLAHLSGGQKTRALLARLLLESPDLLILDEPTNHLDIAAVQWLEHTLREWTGTVLVVSHDRYFLDTVVDRIWEMSRTGIEVYRGHYTAYVDQRGERWERYKALFDSERARLEAELDFIRRYVDTPTNEIAKGKLKRLSRELFAIQALGLTAVIGKKWSELGIDAHRPMTVDEAAAAIRGLTPPRDPPPALTLRLKPPARGGDLVLRTYGLTVGYPGNPLFQTADIILNRRECAALIGPNGAGKTTFLRTALGQLAPLTGNVQLGAGLKVGYFAQAHESLDPSRTALDTVIEAHHLLIPAARHHLAAYGFRGDDIYKPVAALSGGERGRLALALLSLDGANFLLLDEPTNHLDIGAQEILQAGLESFGGTLLIVSHDRYLIDRLATQIWEIRNGRLEVFPGTYQEYLAAREREVQQAKAAAIQAAQGAKAAAPPLAPRPDREARKRAERVSALEAQITEVEAALSRCTQELQAAGEAHRYADLGPLSDHYATTQAHLDRLLAEWEVLAAG